MQAPIHLSWTHLQHLQVVGSYMALALPHWSWSTTHVIMEICSIEWTTTGVILGWSHVRWCSSNHIDHDALCTLKPMLLGCVYLNPYCWVVHIWTHYPSDWHGESINQIYWQPQYQIPMYYTIAVYLATALHSWCIICHISAGQSVSTWHLGWCKKSSIRKPNFPTTYTQRHFFDDLKNVMVHHCNHFSLDALIGDRGQRKNFPKEGLQMLDICPISQ